MSVTLNTIEACAVELAKAVEVIMNPVATQQARFEGHSTCEHFKQESPLCLKVGWYMAKNIAFGQYVRHFGFQLIEHTIKYKWQSIEREEKMSLLDEAMTLLNLGVGSVTDPSLSPLKDALSRIVVEMMKSEWSNQWANPFVELSAASNKGIEQCELVLLVFLRLIEDATSVKSVPSNHRRTSFIRELSKNAEDLFEFFLRLVQQHVTAFREATIQGNLQLAKAHNRIVDLLLSIFNRFIEWMTIPPTLSSNGKLLEYLCLMLNDKEFQCKAAECLAQITNKKGLFRDKLLIVTTYGTGIIRYVHAAIQVLPDASSIEHNHNFLKRLLQVLSGMVPVFGHHSRQVNVSPQRPPCFENFLECILLLVQHPSLTVTHQATRIWSELLRFDNVSKDAATIQCIPLLIQAIGPRIIKIAYPKVRCMPTQMTTMYYICIDFEHEEEFCAFLDKSRSDFLNIFRRSAIIKPLETFAYCEKWIQNNLNSIAMDDSNAMCSEQNPIYLEFSAFDCVLHTVIYSLELHKERRLVEPGLRLLDEFLKMETNNPLIFSLQLSCMMSLFKYCMKFVMDVPSSETFVPRVLSKIFAALYFKPLEKPKMEQKKATTNLCTDAAYTFSKLTSICPRSLLPMFDEINAHVSSLLNAPDTQPHCNRLRYTLHEAVITLSNNFGNFERQTKFLEDLIRQNSTDWIRFRDGFQTSQDFIRCIGLDKPAILQNESDQVIYRCSRILDELSVIFSIIRRCEKPSDLTQAQSGGFVVGLTEVGNPIYRNSATCHILPFLSDIVVLTRSLNELYKPESAAAVSEGYKSIFSFSSYEKQIILGSCAITDQKDSATKTEPTCLEKTKNYIAKLVEMTYQIMGSAGEFLGPDFYGLEGLAQTLNNSIFAYLDFIPDHRLVLILRIFFIPFAGSCPSTHFESVLLPIFAHLTPFMCDRLTSRWSHITTLCQSGVLKVDEDIQEILEDRVNCTLTRTYLEILEHALLKNTKRRLVRSHLIEISELGAKLLRIDVISNNILLTLLRALIWNDGSCNLKAIKTTGPVMQFLNENNLIDESKAVSAFTAVLQSMQVHGEHQHNLVSLQRLGLRIYELLRPNFASVSGILQQIPNVNPSDIHKLDELILTPVPSEESSFRVDMDKRTLFKSLTEPIVGRSIGEMFRYDLPS